MQSNTALLQHKMAAWFVDRAQALALNPQPAQCMGGWCRVRERCMHYSAFPKGQREPAERLCPKGSDEPEPIK